MKTIVLSLLAAVCLSLVACGGGDPAEPTNGSWVTLDPPCVKFCQPRGDAGTDSTVEE